LHSGAASSQFQLQAVIGFCDTSITKIAIVIFCNKLQKSAGSYVSLPSLYQNIAIEQWSMAEKRNTGNKYDCQNVG
jgi:hypothetical protein